MQIDCREALFQTEGRCRNCMSQEHASYQCQHPPQCDKCKDPNDPAKGFHHPTLCYHVWGFPTRGRGGRGRGARGGGGRGGGAQNHSNTQDQNVGYVQHGQQGSRNSFNQRGGQSWGANARLRVGSVAGVDATTTTTMATSGKGTRASMAIITGVIRPLTIGADTPTTTANNQQGSKVQDNKGPRQQCRPSE
jgi:hypothetical protein